MRLVKGTREKLNSEITRRRLDTQASLAGSSGSGTMIRRAVLRNYFNAAGSEGRSGDSLTVETVGGTRDTRQSNGDHPTSEPACLVVQTRHRRRRKEVLVLPESDARSKNRRRFSSQSPLPNVDSKGRRGRVKGRLPPGIF